MPSSRLPTLLGVVWCLMVMVNGCVSSPSSPYASLQYNELPQAKAVKQALEHNRGLVKTPRLKEVQFAPDGKSVWVKNSSGWRAFDLNAGLEVDVQGQTPPGDEKTEEADKPNRSDDRRKRTRVPRGEQAREVASPDEQWTAVHSDNNILLRDPCGDERPVTIEGTANRSFGTASWVYGEELEQKTAMWFSPDSTMLAFYAFDVTDVPTYNLLSGLTELRPTVLNSPYPKPGDPNPVADLQIFDIERGQMTTVDVGDRDDQYVYRVTFTPDSRYLLFHRMNRLQNLLEIVRVDPTTGDSTVLFTESQPTWVDYKPKIRWLEDDRRFLIATERSGFRTWELWDVDSGRLAVLGPGTFPANSIVRVDEDAPAPGGGTLYFSGYSDTHPLNQQLYAIHFDGSGLRRLTDDSLNHSNFKLSPDGANLIATATTAAKPPHILLYGPAGEVLTVIAKADLTRLKASDARPSELFSFEAADGQTCFGRIHYPSNFDPFRMWPVLVQAYGGPESRAVRNTFQISTGRTECGFVIVQIDNRGTEGRGKAFEGATYLKLGQIDLDDQARGIQVLADRHDWLNTERVGITGHSYGGYMSVLALLRHPDVFSVAVASSPVTDWRNYDTIYTERYMQTPAENEANYDAGSCVKLAEQLEGKLLLLHGMVDDNVHPTNCWQLAAALQSNNLPFDMQVYPDSSHNIHLPASRSAKWSFLIEHLVETR